MSGVRHQLPYTPIAAVLPCLPGWLVLPGRLQGITVLVEPAFVARRLTDVIDYRPAFEAIALGAPVGFPDTPVGGSRGCDRAAREVLGWPRRAAVSAVPSRPALHASSAAHAAGLDPSVSTLAYRRFARWREIDDELQPFHQRTVFSTHPELSFHLLNGDEPVVSSPHTRDGQDERLALAMAKLPGVDAVVDVGVALRGVTRRNLIDAAGLLWSARRIAGRVVNRYPDDPEWNEDGVRMELVR